MKYQENDSFVIFRSSKIEYPHRTRVKEPAVKILIVEDEKKTGEYLTKGPSRSRPAA
jgi:hypothetical protein